METACLKIKFTPFLQETQKSSEKCCLEIIPEVSCIHNLDKLTWKEESNMIEYCIPMTYKIILKKNHIKDTNEDIVKTYHSCVDLIPSSQSNFDLASGDISRIISDTFIINKIQNSISKRDNINLTALDDKVDKIIQNNFAINGPTLDTKEPTNNEIEKELIVHELIKSPEQYERFFVDTLLCDKPTSTERKPANKEIENELVIHEQSDEQKQNSRTNMENKPTNKETENELIVHELTKSESKQNGSPILDKLLFDKPTSTENVMSMIINRDRNAEAPDNIFKQLGSKPKLSCSPICSINTQDIQNISLTNTASKGVTCEIQDSSKSINWNMHDSQKELNRSVLQDCISNFSDFMNENQISNIVSQIGTSSVLNPTGSLQFLYNDRSPPEIRIAQYIHYMEKELMPLNVTLEEIISKCRVLGVYDPPSRTKKSSNNKFLLYKSMYMYNNYLKTETRETTSNRAVYSIVFDE